jgi:hypothetical protein
VVSLLKDRVRTRTQQLSKQINTDLLAFFEAEEGPLPSRALFLSLMTVDSGSRGQDGGDVASTS